jgi:hypothetical protein
MSKSRSNTVLTLQLPAVPAAGASPELLAYLRSQRAALEDLVRQLNQQLTPGYTPPVKGTT